MRQLDESNNSLDFIIDDEIMRRKLKAMIIVMTMLWQ